VKRREDEIPISRRLTQTPYNLLGALLAGFIVLAFCLILLWHDPLVFWNDDYELSVLPVFADMARSWSEGHWPILSPYSWVCGNLAGEFQYGVFSVFVNTVVIAVWKFPLTFPQQAAAVSIAHLFALAVGAFLLARDRHFSVPLSIFVALIASLNGWIMGRDGLVRRAWRLYMAALGVVGCRARSRSTAKQMEIPLAGAVCLPRRYWGISLHGFDAAPLDRLAGNQVRHGESVRWRIVSQNARHFVDCANALWRGTRFRVSRSRVARDS